MPLPTIPKLGQIAQLRKDAMKGTPQRSVRWYQDKIRSLGLSRVSPENALQSEIGTLKSRVTLGNMFLYFYDPKLKERLPYYDTFPLVIPFRYNADGFHGLNLHYLPPLVRMNLLSGILNVQNTQGISWDVLGKIPEVAPCVKQYLYPHVRSRFLKINSEDWNTTIMLPLERFAKSSKFSVYQESVRKINNG